MARIKHYERKKKDDGLKPLVITSIIIFATWIIALIIMNVVIKDPNERGLFGDSFGGLNALFSGLAFAGIIYTILLQRKELRLQREELKETRKELNRSANAQEKSEQALNKQIEALKNTAILNGYNSIAEFHTSIANTPGINNASKNIQLSKAKQVIDFICYSQRR